MTDLPEASSNVTSTKEVTCPTCHERVTFTQTGRRTKPDGRAGESGMDYTTSLSCGHDAGLVE